MAHRVQSELTDILGKLPFSKARKPVIAGVVVVLIMVAVFAGRAIIDTATANDFTIAREQQASLDRSTSVSSANAQTQPQTIFVHVAGAVRNPGLYELRSGARVAEGIEAAGGFSEQADANCVNLARVLADGEQLVVAEASAVQEQAQGPTVQAAGSAAQAAQAAGSAAQAAISNGKVNINKATAAELETLPGIGAATAAKIVSERTANGPFASVDDLKRVSGIGDKKLEALSGLICV